MSWSSRARVDSGVQRQVAFLEITDEGGRAEFFAGDSLSELEGIELLAVGMDIEVEPIQ